MSSPLDFSSYLKATSPSLLLKPPPLSLGRESPTDVRGRRGNGLVFHPSSIFSSSARRHILLLLFFFGTVSLLPLISIAQESCHINALVSEQSSTFAPDCPVVTPHGGRCRLDGALCDTHFGMVLEGICVDSEWHWPDDPEFCAFWQGCVFTPPYELHCTGSSDKSHEDGPGRLPTRMDPRLRIVSANFLNINRHIATTRLPRLQHLNLSHNIITELANFALQQTNAARVGPQLQ